MTEAPSVRNFFTFTSGRIVPLLACAVYLATSNAFVPVHRHFATTNRFTPSHARLFNTKDDDNSHQTNPMAKETTQADAITNENDNEVVTDENGNAVPYAIGKNKPKNPFFDRSDPSRFDLGDDLVQLRSDIKTMEKAYQNAIDSERWELASVIQAKLKRSRMRDAEWVYMESTGKMNEALDMGDEDDAERWRWERSQARQSMPQFNMQGLWVGKYGLQGYEMVNITYAGDTLIATKVTGDKNVPRGEISFTADLQPRTVSDPKRLSHIELSEAAAAKWDHKMLPRFPGSGQVASDGFKDAQFVDGQLILIGDYFSFAWVPQKYQIFFGRPSSDLTIKMLRDYIAAEDEMTVGRAMAQRMFNGECLGGEIADGQEILPRRISTNAELKDIDETIQNKFME